jgi:hypothetical protein
MAVFAASRNTTMTMQQARATAGSDHALRAHIQALAKEEPFFHKLFETALRRSVRPRFYTDTAGLDISFENTVNDLPNRARLKFFRPGEQKRMVAFFYKRSLLPHSRDRFAYGCCVFRPEATAEADTAAWFEYAESGFTVPKRPAGWMRGVPFEVPE